MIEIKLGDIVNNKYRIDSVLGEGGMGTVYKAKEIGLDRNVALKVPKPAMVKNDDFMHRFGREAKLVAKLNHDNIVQVFEFYNHPELVFMALEFVRGAELNDLVKRPPRDMTVGDILNVLGKACDGVAYAHENGVVHRDIKPANILVSRNRDGTFRVKVMDFGIAHVGQGELFTQQLTELTQAGSAMGTPSYMSPEQVEGRKVTARSDNYSMACVYFFAFTLRTVFEGSLFTIISQHVNSPPPDPSSLNPHLPPEFNDVIQKGLAKDPEKRYGTARELARAAHEALAPHSSKLFADYLPPGAVDESEPIELASQTPSTSPTRPTGEAATIVDFREGEATKAFSPDDDEKIGSPFEQTSGGAAINYPPPTISSMRGAGGYEETRTFGSGGGADTGNFEATALLPEDARPQAAAGASSSKSGLILTVVILVLLVAGAGAWFVMNQGPDAQQRLTELLGREDYAAAVALLEGVQGESRSALEDRLLEELRTRRAEAVQLFERKNATQLNNSLPRDLAFAEDLADSGVPAAQDIAEELRTLDRALPELVRYNSLYSAVANNASVETINSFEEQANTIVSLVSGIVSPAFENTIESDIKALRLLLPKARVTPPPTPAEPTPSPEEEAAKAYARLTDQLNDPTITVDRKLSDWRAFQRSYPRFEKIEEVVSTIEKLEREVTITPDMVVIDSALRFTMGSAEGRGRDDEKPQHNIQLEPFAIARHEVPASAFAIFLNEMGNENERYMTEGAEAATVIQEGGSYVAAPNAAMLPANYVTWYGAVAYAEWLSDQLGRTFDLPTEAEWERVASGPSGTRRYPWGDDINVNKARYSQSLPNTPPFYSVMVEVTRMPDGQSEEGVYNLAGNVAEWVKDWYERSYDPSEDYNPDGPDQGLQKVVRGGSWETWDNENLRVRARDRRNPDVGYIDVGFRVVERF